MATDWKHKIQLYEEAWSISPSESWVKYGKERYLLFTALIGMFLYAVEHSLSIWGIFLTMIWALPLTVSYIKTKNIYVPMTAHLIGNLLGNGIDVVMTIITWI